MVLNLPCAAGKALPVTLKEFRTTLSSIWNCNLQAPCAPPTLGLAISGGVDSMALASLCSKLQSSNLSDWTFRAFVVDHGARAGSDEEAKAVAALVKDKGIETKVLKIKWPKDLMPSTSSKFESLARRYRFQILGEACRDSNIRSLILAHHEDDHFETVLMRLVNGHHGRGLLGIRSDGRIPECYGIYGVYDSGATAEDSCRPLISGSGILNEERGISPNEESTEAQNTPEQNGKLDEDVDSVEFQEAPEPSFLLEQMRFENGGIRVLRPLLQYSKERLIATCLQDKTSWFEDPTNADPTLTPRNAIRNMYKRHALPEALQKDRIIALSASMQQRKAALDTKALAMLQQCAIQDFEPRAGSLLVRFPKFDSLQSNLGIRENNSARHPTRREIAYELLKYVIGAMSPYEDSKYQLDRVCNTVFPELHLPDCQYQGRVYLDKFTASGVMFEKKPISHPTELPDLTSSAVSNHEVPSHCETIPMQDCEWTLSRQPYPSTLERQPLLEYPPVTSSPAAAPNDNWKFYDGRYWIRVLNYSPHTLHVRPLRKTDLPALKGEKVLRERLQRFAPGGVRFTLPVIVIVEDGRERVLGLPTLDVVVDGAEEVMSYEIRYKRVEWPALQGYRSNTRQIRPENIR